jgi:hypothetical protein
MAAHGGPIGHARDGEVRLVGEFHGWGGRGRGSGGICIEDQVDRFLVSIGRGNDGGGTTAKT